MIFEFQTKAFKEGNKIIVQSQGSTKYKSLTVRAITKEQATPHETSQHIKTIIWNHLTEIGEFVGFEVKPSPEEGEIDEIYHIK